MTWFDIVAFLLLALVIWLESVRGFGRALFDLVGAIILLKVGPVLANALAAAAPVMDGKGANQAFWLAFTFVVLALAFLVITRLIYHSTLLSLDYLDPTIGALLGLFIGLITVFFFLRTLQLTYGSGPQGDILIQSFVGQEVLKLRSYHTVLAALYNLGK